MVVIGRASSLNSLLSYNKLYRPEYRLRNEGNQQADYWQSKLLSLKERLGKAWITPLGVVSSIQLIVTEVKTPIFLQSFQGNAFREANLENPKKCRRGENRV